MGNRTIKIVQPTNGPATWKWQYYVRDANGEVIATYRRTTRPLEEEEPNPGLGIYNGDPFISTWGEAFGGESVWYPEPGAVNTVSYFTVGEYHLYGSSRLGLHPQSDTLKALFYMAEATEGPEHYLADTIHYTTPQPIPPVHPHLTANGLRLGHLLRGDKRYELTNHLGNVLSIVSDRKLPTTDGDSLTVRGYTPDVLARYDYYPFGMQRPDWVQEVGDYRYGFQGEEKDDEIYGPGNAISFKYRVHDPRIGRFLSVDPLAPEYPFYSTYAFSGNRVMDRVELEGLEPGLIFHSLYSTAKLTKATSNWISERHQYGMRNVELAEKVGGTSFEKTAVYTSAFFHGDEGLYQFTPGPSLEALTGKRDASGFEIGMAVFEFASAGFGDDAVRLVSKMGGKMQDKWKFLWNSRAAENGFPTWDQLSSEIQLHHIIPEKFKSHKLIKSLGDEFDIQSLDNGIPLPRFSRKIDEMGDGAHGGAHGEYNEYVTRALDDIYDDYSTTEERLERVYLLKQNLTNHIENLINNAKPGGDNRLNEYFKDLNSNQ